MFEFVFFRYTLVMKFPSVWNVDGLPVRPIVSSIGTATYETSKYLAQKSRYTVDSTYEFIWRIRRGSVGDDFDMVSFDVTSLFTNVPLDFTIDIVLKKIYREKKIKTKLKKTGNETAVEYLHKRYAFYL